MLNQDQQQNNLEEEQMGVEQKIKQVDGFVQNRYKQNLKQLVGYNHLFQLILTIDVLASISLIVYLKISNVYPLFLYLILAILAFFTLLNIFYHKQYQIKSLKKDIQSQNKIYLFTVLQILFQIDFLQYFNYCKVRLAQLTQPNKITIQQIRNEQNGLIRWYSFRMTFTILKAYALLSYIVIRYIYDRYFNTMIDDIYILTVYFIHATLQHIILNHLYLQLFVFQNKLTYLQSLITLIESIAELTQAYSSFIATIINTLLRISISCLAIIYSTILRCQAQHQGYFNPQCIGLIKQIFGGSKLTYLATLWNSDINQQEMVFNNVFNLIQFLIAEIYKALVYAFILYYQGEQFPSWLIYISMALILYTVCMAIIKFFLIKTSYQESKFYEISSLTSLRKKNLNRKCKLKLKISSQIDEKDCQSVLNILNVDSQQLQIMFKGQFSINYTLGYAHLQIHNIESACLKTVYNHLLSKSIYINIQIDRGMEEYKRSKKAISLLFSCLYNTSSIQDQKKVDIENSDVVKYFENEDFYKEMVGCLRQFNQEKILVNTIAFYKYLADYQSILPQMLLYDILD